MGADLTENTRGVAAVTGRVMAAMGGGRLAVGSSQDLSRRAT